VAEATAAAEKAAAEKAAAHKAAAETETAGNKKGEADNATGDIMELKKKEIKTVQRSAPCMLTFVDAC